MTPFLRADLARAWRDENPFERAAHQSGVIYRAREGRRTLQFEINQQRYFLKYHGGIGWREIFKNLSQGKWPILGALSEVRAIRAVADAGIETLSIAGYGQRGLNPARRESFLVTDELVNTLSLEELGARWRTAPGAAHFKWALIRRVGEIAKAMHDAGVNHRDFYLAHFLISRAALEREDDRAALHLIDLHRSQVRARVPRRWRVKDIGGLYFSTAPLELTRRDLLRFVRVYTGMPLREALKNKRRLLADSQREGERIYRRYYQKEPAFPLPFCEDPGNDD